MRNEQNRNMGRKDLKKGIIDRPIRFRTSLSNTIADVMRARGWQEVTSDSAQPNEWDIHWCDREWLKENYDHTYFQEHVRICHFRNHYELTRKNLMVKNLRRMKKLVERENGKASGQAFEFYPMTFELPSEYHIFVEEFKKFLGHIWIMKPVAKSQGKGIFLFKKLKDITDWKKGEYNANPDPSIPTPETYVVQRYIHNPYLINGRKFDIRVYVLVTSYNPLKAWLYRSGFARFSNQRYSLESIDDSYVHLTNVAIQKTAPDYDPEKGSKWSLQQLRRYLTAKHGRETVDKTYVDMDNIFIKCLQSVQKVIINDKHCFEMYGFDILLDENLKPWLIEINASPSLTASSGEDYVLKYGLLTDVLNVIDLEGRLSGKERRVGGFDLIWDDGPVMEEDSAWDAVCISSETPNSFLGCYNDDREQQLTQLYKSLAVSKAKQTAAA